MTPGAILLRRCVNPHCWRHFPAPDDSRRDCCDEDCDRAAAAAKALAERLAGTASLTREKVDFRSSPI